MQEEQEGQETCAGSQQYSSHCPGCLCCPLSIQVDERGEDSAPKGSRTPVTTLKEWCPYR